MHYGISRKWSIRYLYGPTEIIFCSLLQRYVFFCHWPFVIIAEEFSCPGFYHCQGARQCVAPDRLCDGISDCPHGDDETVCNIECPSLCVCAGRSVYCEDRNLDILPHLVDIHSRQLNLKKNNINRLSRDKLNLPFLSKLFLSHNKVTQIFPGAFQHLQNLLVLINHGYWLSKFKSWAVLQPGFETKNIKVLNLCSAFF